ncbi:MAG TPA: Lpg1974 family pore-forming outer membrane protein [Chlamydiales bacterium]|nr:Lpg1974 family pore-forming outer membrane protein [Chlamydiales bacterium]
MAINLHAIPPDPCEPEVEPVCCIDPIPGPFAFAYPLDLGINCPRDFYFHIDGLAFQAKQDGMEFAIQARSETSGRPIAPITYGKVIGFGFSDGCGSWDYNPGARVGLGFYLDHDAWNIDLNWTWVHVTNYKSVHADHDSVLIPLWLLGSSDAAPGVFGTSASAAWNVCYNVFDLSLAKPYYVSRYFILNPFFGARVADIHQHFSVHYAGSTPEFEAIHHGEKNEFYGVGARFGVNSDWILGKGWWLFANFSASLLAGKFEVHQNLNVPANGTTITPSGVDGFDIHSDYFQNTPNMEIALGLAWSKAFDCNRYRVGLRAAYEFVEWWDQLNMRKFFSGNPGYANDVVSRGNLTFNGFSLKLQLDL